MCNPIAIIGKKPTVTQKTSLHTNVADEERSKILLQPNTFITSLTLC